MPAVRILDDDGNNKVVQAGEGSQVTATFQDNDGNQLTKAQLATVTATLFDRLAESAINSRNDQTVIDDNGGTLAADGTLTMKLSEDDNTCASGVRETHVLRFKYTWSEGPTKPGIQEYLYDVEPVVTPS